jgi:hypothetical protein
MADARLLAVYRDAASAARALHALRERGLLRVETVSPVPAPALQAAGFGRPSPVRVFTLAGGALGCIAGLALSIWTSLSWPLMTGGKPIVSLPAFLIIAFELAILLGALSTLCGFLLQARLPRKTGAAYDPRFSEDRYGVLVTAGEGDAAGARELLDAAGAEEVRLA